MEEHQEIQTDDKMSYPEKKHNRIYKTPAQLAALENFYNEHKYPSEAMKIEFAEATGLTEKQVSGWFCHRRLKDKKIANDEVQTHGKQDRSSGVIQDHNSGQKQDSCGSTKQGDNKQFDPKEVESKRYTTNEGFKPTQLRYEHECQYNTIMDMDNTDNDTSSESSSRLKDHIISQNVDHMGMVTSKFPTRNDVMSVTGRTGPSGYLKVKGQSENVAITAVKRQLGRQYQEDGPPLGIEFDPLPPGAFENPTEVPINQSHYVGDSVALHSMDDSRTFQHPNASKMYRRYDTSYDPVDMDESGLKMRRALKPHEQYYNNEFKQTPRFSKHRNLNDDSCDEASIHDLRDQFEPKMKHGPGLRRPDTLSNQAENYSYPRSHNVGPAKYIDRIEPLTSDLNFTQGEFEDRRLSRKTSKDNRFDGQRRGIDERHRNEMMVHKRSRDEFMHKVNRRKEKVVDVHQITNKTLLDLANCADER